MFLPPLSWPSCSSCLCQRDVSPAEQGWGSPALDLPPRAAASTIQPFPTKDPHLGGFNLQGGEGWTALSSQGVTTHKTCVEGAEETQLQG